MHTLRPQQVPTAHTLPKAHSALDAQPTSPAHGVLPSTQNPVPPVMLAHTHEPPGPQGAKVEQVCPAHEEKAQAPLVQVWVGH